MTIKTVKREVGPLSMRAAVGTVDNARRTVEVVFSTGAAVLRSSYFDGPSFEELSMDPAHVRMGRLQNGAPFLSDHRSSLSSVIGVVESARLENGKGIATIRFAKAEDDPEADKIYRKVKDGLITGVSVGYRTYRSEKVEGGSATIPTFRATDWEPYEISAVALPADAAAGFRSADAGSSNLCNFLSRSMENLMTPEELAKIEADAAAKRAAAELTARTAMILKGERERVSAIRAAARVGGLDETQTSKMIDDGTTADNARAFVLEQLATRSDAIKIEPHVTTEIGDDSIDKAFRGMTAQLYAQSGDQIARAVKMNAPGFAGVNMDPGAYRGYGLMDMARETLELNGVKTRGMTREAVVSAAFTKRGVLSARGTTSGYATTGDFPILLENVLGKQLMASYAITPDTWSRIAKIETVPDFRDSPRYQAGSFGALDPLNEHGEFKNKAIPDGAKKVINVATKGNMIGVSRQLIINDDMSALADLLSKLGRAARLSIEADFYAFLALNSGLGPTQSDSQPFFHANRANVNSSASAMGVAGIDADRVIMVAQKDISSNDYLDVRPAVLLIASGQLAAAKVVNNSAYNHDSTKLQQPNAVQGLFRDIVDSPRLSGTRRYIFADASVAPAIVVAFLEGQGQGPVLESRDGWRMDGTEMKVRLDYKVQGFEPKGAMTNAGA